MKPFLLSALALGALTTAALAEQPTAPTGGEGIAKTQGVTTSTAAAGPIELTDTEMDAVVGGNHGGGHCDVPSCDFRTLRGDFELLRDVAVILSGGVIIDPVSQ